MTGEMVKIQKQRKRAKTRTCGELALARSGFEAGGEFLKHTVVHEKDELKRREKAKREFRLR